MKKGNISESEKIEVQKQLGIWLREKRKEKGWTIDQFAEIIGLDKATVSKVENGAWNLTLSTLSIFIKHLEVYPVFMDGVGDTATLMEIYRLELRLKELEGEN